MKLYLAGERENISKDGGRPKWSYHGKRRLFSYYYHRTPTGGISDDVLASEKIGFDMFLDSGAFTAFTQKVRISVEDYAAWIRKHGHYFAACSNLDDTNKNEQVTYDNQKALESLDCKVQPVFHTREDPKWLAKYLDEGYDYIFIGGMVPETSQWLTLWLDDIFDKYLTNQDGTARVKLHGFGLTDVRLMFRYPWYSIDSTSWLMVGIYGDICVYDEKLGYIRVPVSKESPKARKWNGWHYDTLNKEQKATIDRLIEPTGITVEQCAEHYSFRDAVNCYTYQNLEKYGTREFHAVQKELF